MNHEEKMNKVIELVELMNDEQLLKFNQLLDRLEQQFAKEQAQTDTE